MGYSTIVLQRQFEKRRYIDIIHEMQINFHQINVPTIVLFIYTAKPFDHLSPTYKLSSMFDSTKGRNSQHQYWKMGNILKTKGHETNQLIKTKSSHI